MNLLRRTGLTATVSLGLGLAFVAGFATANHAATGTPVQPRLRLADQALTTGASCDDLLSWYVDRAVERVTPWGWNQPMVYASTTAAGVEDAPVAAPDRASDSSASTIQEADSSATGTNVQEAGVDEPDIAKTDGRLLVRVGGGALSVYDVTGPTPVRDGTATLAGMSGGDVLLAGTRAVVIGADASTTGTSYPLGSVGPSGTRLMTFDLADPSHPTLVDSRVIEGGLVAARQTGDVIRVVVSGGLPSLDFTAPDLPNVYPPTGYATDDSANGGAPDTSVSSSPLPESQTPTQQEMEAAQQRALDHNRGVVRATTIEDWLPHVTTYDGGTAVTTPLVDCSDVAIPRDDSGLGTLTVVGFDAAHPDQPSVSAVATPSRVAYFSTDSLYVAAGSAYPTWGCCTDLPESGVSPDATQLYDFGLSGTDATYVASGSVQGLVTSRWSMDEHDGVLRVAHPTLDNANANAISLLRASAGNLDEIGTVGGLGRGQQIRAVRWFDDVAIVVTAEQVDPLYAVSLTDPTNPRLLGALHLPGWSSYLHPIGGDRLIGLGQTSPRIPVDVVPVPEPPLPSVPDVSTSPSGPVAGSGSGPVSGSGSAPATATATGPSYGPKVELLPRGKATLFDIADLTHPRGLSTLTYPAGTVVQAALEPHQVTWLPAEHTLLAVVTTYDAAPRAWVSVLHVAGDTLTDRLVEVGPTSAIGEVRTLPLPDGRVVLVTHEDVRFLGLG